MVANFFATLVVAGSNPYPLAVFLLFFPFNWTWIRSEEFGRVDLAEAADGLDVATGERQRLFYN